jgi:hypothetical protein
VDHYLQRLNMTGGALPGQRCVGEGLAVEYVRREGGGGDALGGEGAESDKPLRFTWSA